MIFTLIGSGTTLSLIFILFNLFSFAFFVLGDKDVKVKLDKSLKFIEGIVVLISFIMLLCLAWLVLAMFHYEVNGSLGQFITVVYILLNFLGMVSYYILRFSPIKKLSEKLKKFLCSYMVIVIIINVILTTLMLFFAGVIGTYLPYFMPINLSLFYFKTLLIAKDNL